MRRCQRFGWGLVGISFLVTSPMTPIHGVQYVGLKIDFISVSPQVTQAVDVEKLTDVPFAQRKGSHEPVLCKLLQGGELDVSDTDDEEEKIGTEVENKARQEDKALDELCGVHKEKQRPYNRSRHMPKPQTTAYNHLNNYLCVDISMDELRRQLSCDAFDIVGSERNVQTQKSTVCLCVALRDKEGYIKKFVFRNGQSVMPPAMRDKA